MDAATLGVLVFLIVVIVAGVWYLGSTDPRRKERSDRQAEEERLEEWRGRAVDELTSTIEFKWAKRYVNHVTKNGIAVDSVRQKVCIFSFEAPGATSQRILRPCDILRVEVVEDGQTVVTTTPRNTVGNAMLGGLLFGGAGAVVGAMSSRSEATTAKEVHSLGLRVLVDDLNAPFCEVEFLEAPCLRDSERFREAANTVKYYHSALEVLIQRASRDEH